MSPKAEILVVDDDPDIRHALQLVLESNGYKVHTACDSQEAFKVLENVKPDLMILDVMMRTDTEGFDLAYQLKNNLGFVNTPIIMLTAFFEKLRADGVEEFQSVLGEEWPARWLFEKPVDNKKLLAKIEGILNETLT